MAKQVYEVWQVEADGTYRPLVSEFKTGNKAKAVQLARALAKSDAFRHCV